MIVLTVINKLNPFEEWSKMFSFFIKSTRMTPPQNFRNWLRFDIHDFFIHDTFMTLFERSLKLSHSVPK